MYSIVASLLGFAPASQNFDFGLPANFRFQAFAQGDTKGKCFASLRMTGKRDVFLKSIATAPMDRKTKPPDLCYASLAEKTRTPPRNFLWWCFFVGVNLLKPPLCKWEKICKQIGTARRDGGIVKSQKKAKQSLSHLR